MITADKLIYLIDMDGTLYRGASPIEYAKEFIRYLQQNRRDFFLATNCPGRSAGEIAEKLASMGMEVTTESVLTSGQVTASVISNRQLAKKVYVVGSYALKQEMIQKGIRVVNRDPDAVVVGFDRKFSYDKMEKAVRFIHQGAKFIVTNEDAEIPEGGLTVPHTGAIAASIEKASGVKPQVIGKPERYFIDMVREKLNCSSEQCCVIGDRLDTDIAMGIRFGITSYLVMTGVTSEAELKESPIQPTRVFRNLQELMDFEQKG